jgi:hypothetical protein
MRIIHAFMLVNSVISVFVWFSVFSNKSSDDAACHTDKIKADRGTTEVHRTLASDSLRLPDLFP